VFFNIFLLLLEVILMVKLKEENMESEEKKTERYNIIINLLNICCQRSFYFFLDFGMDLNEIILFNMRISWLYN